MKIVRNISLKIYWRKEAAKRSGHYTIALEEIEGCIADQKTVEDEIEARELARIIEAFLDTLTVKERVIFMRRYAYADTYADIAKRVGISEKNVSVRLTLRQGGSQEQTSGRLKQQSPTPKDKTKDTNPRRIPFRFSGCSQTVSAV